MTRKRYVAGKLINSTAGLAVAMVDPATVPEFEPVAAALRRGTARSKLRALEVVCSHNRRLAEVFGTGPSAVVLAWGRRAALPDGPGVVLLSDLDPDGPMSPSEDRTVRIGHGTVMPVLVQNRCCTSPLWGNWLAAQIKNRRKRSIWQTA